jgi:predicted nucleic acid-binding protein
MAAIKRSFDDVLESIIYWDASYAIAYYVDTEPYHNECVDFRNRLEAESILSNYSILPTDAFHIATALSHGVAAFATLDEDFLKVDGITVYTCLT